MTKDVSVTATLTPAKSGSNTSYINYADYNTNGITVKSQLQSGCAANDVVTLYLGGSTTGLTYTVSSADVTAVGNSMATYASFTVTPTILQSIASTSFTTYVTDEAGNTSTVSSTLGLTKDVTAPAAPTASGSPSVSLLSAATSSTLLGIGATITFTLTGDASGLSLGTSASVDGDTSAVSLSSSSGTTYTIKYTVASGDTAQTSTAGIPVNITLADAAGNESTAYSTAVASYGIDAAKPTISSPTASYTSPPSEAATLTPGASDTGGSGLSKVYFGTTTAMSSSVTYGTTVDVTTAAGNTFYFYVTDAAGNGSAQYFTMTWSSGDKTYTANTGTARSIRVVSLSKPKTVSIARSSSSSNLLSDSDFNIKFNDGNFSSSAEAQRADTVRSAIVMQPISMRYAPTVASRVGASTGIDASGFSLLNRAAKSKTETAVRYTERQGSSRSSSGAQESAPAATQASRSSGVSQSQASAAATGAKAASEGSSTLGATELRPMPRSSAPVGKKLPAPQKESAPGTELYVEQEDKKKEDREEIVENGEFADFRE